MRMSRSDLDEAVRAGVIDRPAADALWAFLCRRAARGRSDAGPPAPFDMRHLLWYAGGLIVIFGLGLFAIEASERFGSLALAALAVVYGGLFAMIGAALWRRPALRTPGALLITIAVAMAPLAIFAMQDHFGWLSLYWAAPGEPFMRWVLRSGVPMALSATVVGAIAMRFYRFAFLAMVIALASWGGAVALTPWLAAEWRYGGTHLSGLVSILFGILLLPMACLIDRRQRNGDFGFWLHLAAGLAILGGSWQALTGSAAAWSALCAISVLMVLIGVFVQRKLYALLGALGIASYLAYLTYDVFTDALQFAAALAAIGVAIMLLGYLYHRHEPQLQAWLARRLPAGLQRLRPAPPPPA